MFDLRTRRLASIFATTLCLAGAAHAQGGAPLPAPLEPIKVARIDDVGAGTRVDLSGKLRMLSQRVPAALCAVEAGVAFDSASGILEGSIAEFDAILATLRHGDDARGVFGAEENRKTLYGIQRVDDVWQPMRDYAQQAVAIGPLPVDVASLQERSHGLLDKAKDLVVVISAQYSNPAELEQADALTIDLAGRQRMLAQRMSKNACLLASGHRGNGLDQDLRRTMETYDATLKALISGAPETGVIAPPSDMIAAGLERISGQWSGLSAQLTALREGDTLDTETRTTLFDGFNKLTAEMNTLVGAYAEASKTGL